MHNTYINIFYIHILSICFILTYACIDFRIRYQHGFVNVIRNQEFGLRDKYIKFSQVPVAHTCNPSYSGGRDKKYHDSRPAPAKSS
jgi:hypothetical protein